MIKQWPCICEKPHYEEDESDFCKVCRRRKLSKLTLKLADFGVAKAISKDTAEYGLVGSVLYMAPEYIRETKITPKADVWSFGVLFGELLIKRIPYHNISDLEIYVIMIKIGEGELKPYIPDNCPKEQAELLSGCWEQDDEKRLSMGEVVQMLEKMSIADPEYIFIPKKNESSEDTNQILTNSKDSVPLEGTDESHSLSISENDKKNEEEELRAKRINCGKPIKFRQSNCGSISSHCTSDSGVNQRLSSDSGLNQRPSSNFSNSSASLFSSNMASTTNNTDSD